MKKTQNWRRVASFATFSPTQPIENITSTKNKTGDMSPVLPQSSIVKILSDKRQNMQNSTLAGRLRELRGNESRKAFSLKYGIHEQSLIRYEKGTRIPNNDIIRRIAKGEKVSFDWLIMGTGQMHQDVMPVDSVPSLRESEDMETSDSRKNEGNLYNQHTENNNKKNMGTPQNVRLSENWGQHHKGAHAEKVMELQERLLSAQERLLALTEQNAELRLQLEHRDQRIRELEKENAGLREERKGAAAVQRGDTWKAG